MDQLLHKQSANLLTTIKSNRIKSTNQSHQINQPIKSNHPTNQSNRIIQPIKSNQIAQPISEPISEPTNEPNNINRPINPLNILPGAAAGGLGGPRERVRRPPGREMFPPDFEGRVGAVEGFSQPLQGRAGGAPGGVPAQDSSRILAAGSLVCSFLFLFFVPFPFLSLRAQPMRAMPCK